MINYHKYITSDEWKKKSRNFLKNYKKCQICLNNRPIHTHHRTYKNLGNETNEDLMALCGTCHKKVHFSTNNKKVNMKEYLKSKAFKNCGDPGNKYMTIYNPQ